MQRQLKGSLYYLSTNIRFTLFVFWSILLSLLIVSVVTDLLFFTDSSGSSIVFDLSFPNYVLAAIVGQLTVRRNIPYLIKFGSTRKNLFMGIGIHFVSLAAVSALFANTIHAIVVSIYNLSGNSYTDGALTVSSNEQTFSFNHLADFLQNTWLTRVFIDTSIMFFLLAFAFILGLIFYRFGLVGGFTFLGLLVFTFIIGMTKGWLLEYFISLFKNFNIVFFFQLLLTGIIIYLLSYVLLRKITI